MDVYAPNRSPSSIIVETNSTALSYLLPVDRLKSFRWCHHHFIIRASVFAENVVEKLVAHLLRFDETFREVGIVVCAIVAEGLEADAERIERIGDGE